MAAKHSHYSRWALTAIGAGVALTGVELVGAVGYLVGQDQPSYLVAGGAIITVVAAILPILAGRCWRDRRRTLAIMLWLALVPALSLIFTAALERTGGARDGANRDRQVIAQRIALTRDAEREAKADVEAAEVKASAECSRASKGADPKGLLCNAAEGRAANSRQRLETARDGVAKAGVVPTDPQARRLAAILPGLSEEAIVLYQPLVLPVAISVLGLLLISAGAHTPQPVKVQRRKGKGRKRKPRLGKRPPPTTNVVPLRRRA